VQSSVPYLLWLDTNLSQATIDALFLLTSLLAALVAFPVGVAYRYYSVKNIVSLNIIVVACSCVVLSLLRNIYVLALGMLGLRIAAQGVLYLGNIVLVTRWFLRRRGIALGVTGFFHITLCVNAYPALSRLWIEAYGWRNAYLITAFLGIFFILPTFWILASDYPSFSRKTVDELFLSEKFAAANTENKHLHTSTRRTNSNTATSSLQIFSTNDAIPGNGNARAHKPSLSTFKFLMVLLHSSNWWSYYLCNLGVSIISSALQLHLRALLDEKNMEISTDLALFLAMGLVFALVELVGGVIVDRLSPHILISLCVVSLFVTVILASRISTVSGALALGVSLGFTEGSLRIATNTAWPAFFALENLGLLQSTSNFAVILGQAVGPLLLSAMLSVSNGSHERSFLIFVTIPSMLLVLLIYTLVRQKCAQFVQSYSMTV